MENLIRSVEIRILQMNKTEEEPRVAVVPWNSLLSERFTIPEDCIQQDSNIEYISNELETIFRDKFLEYSLPKMFILSISS